MPIEHKKPFGIYHWDTFDNRTLLVDEADTLAEAQKKVQERYKDRLSAAGADQVDIVDSKGKVRDYFHVT